MSNRRVVVVTAVVVVALVTSVLATPAIPADTRSGNGPTAVTADAPPDESIRDRVETDNVRLTIDVHPNGSAEWTVEYETVLEDENTTEAFESLQNDIEENESAYVQRFADRIRNTVAAAENATGREMNATDFSVDTRIEQVSCRSANGCGVITYTFHWDGFARVEEDGERLIIGDAIEGFFLDEDTRLEIGWDGDYAATKVAPDPDGLNANAVLWRGSETDFVSGEPVVVIERGAETTTTTDGGTTDGGGTTDETTSPGTTTTTDGASEESGGLPMIPLLAGGFAVLALAVGVAWWRTNADRDPGPGSGAAGTTGDGGTPGAAAAADPESDADGGEEAFDIDQELLSNEEQVIKLLETRGGRLKQQEVVSELGWTEAKTSQVISGMREEDAVDTFRLGRENVVTLPDEEIGIGPEETDGGNKGTDD